MFNKTAILMLVLLTAAIAAADPPPTTAELSRMLDDGDYHGAVSGANRLIALSGPAAGGVDRGLLLSIRAEAYLQLKNYPIAADDFAMAANEIADPSIAAASKASEILIRRSSAGIYTPKVYQSDRVTLTQIDIHLRNARPVAYTVLFRDEWTAIQPELKQGKSTHDMSMLLKLLEKSATVRQLEVAATGKDALTHQPLQTLADHAYDLMTAALEVEDQKVTDDKKQAETKVKSQKLELVHKGGRSAYTATVEHVRTAGLSDLLVNDLQSIIADCSKIGPSAKTVGKYWDADKKWSPIVADADRIGARAKEVLNAQYDTADKHDEILLGK